MALQKAAESNGVAEHHEISRLIISGDLDPFTVRVIRRLNPQQCILSVHLGLYLRCLIHEELFNYLVPIWELRQRNIDHASSKLVCFPPRLHNWLQLRLIIEFRVDLPLRVFPRLLSAEIKEAATAFTDSASTGAIVVFKPILELLEASGQVQVIENGPRRHSPLFSASISLPSPTQPRPQSPRVATLGTTLQINRARTRQEMCCSWKPQRKATSTPAILSAGLWPKISVHLYFS